MKILLVTSEYGEKGGGLSFACTRLHYILTSSLAHDVAVVSSNEDVVMTAKGGYNATLRNKISNEYRLKNDTLKYACANIDLVIAFGGSFNGYYAHLLAQKIHRPLFLMLRGTDINMAKWDAQESFYLRQTASAATKIICLSSEMVSNVLDVLPAVSPKCHVIPNIIDSVSGTPNSPNLPQKVVIGCSASHINEKKGIANLLAVVKAFKDLSDTYITLHIIGEIDNDLLNEYKRLAEELSVEGNVIFEGYKSREECMSIQKTWDFYIQGSVCEGFCNSVGECISAGIPVFLSNTGFISETLKEKFPLFTFDSFAPDNIASRLLALVESADKKHLYEQAYALIYEKANEMVVTDMWRKMLCKDKCRMPSSTRQPNIIAVALHEVNGEQHDPITTPESVFTEFVDKLYEHGYGICSLKDYLQKNEEERASWIVCTFDDGYASLTSKVLPILQAKGFTASVFVNSDLIGKDNSWNWKDSRKRMHLNPEGITKLQTAGWEIGSHGHTHRNLLQLTEQELEYEFSKSFEIIGSLVNDLQTYAYPYGASSAYVRKICNRYYKYAFSLHEGGTELCVDNMMIRRYSIDDVIKILSL